MSDTPELDDATAEALRMVSLSQLLQKAGKKAYESAWAHLSTVLPNGAGMEAVIDGHVVATVKLGEKNPGTYALEDIDAFLEWCEEREISVPVETTTTFTITNVEKFKEVCRKAGVTHNDFFEKHVERTVSASLFTTEAIAEIFKEVPDGVVHTDGRAPTRTVTIKAPAMKEALHDNPRLIEAIAIGK